MSTSMFLGLYHNLKGSLNSSFLKISTYDQNANFLIMTISDSIQYVLPYMTIQTFQ